MKTFFFDMDDTLYLRSEPFLRASRMLYPHFREIPDEDLYAVRKKHSDFSFEERKAGRMTMEEMYLYRTRETFLEYGLSLSDEEALAFEECYAKALADIRLRPGMEELLSFLSENQIPMGVLTNGPEKRQYDKMEALKLHRFIPKESCFVSGTLGVDKPDPRIFQLVQERMNLSPADVWYIGDSYEADMEGAHRAGWHTIWLQNSPAPKKEAAHWTVSSSEELFTLLKTLL